MSLQTVSKAVFRDGAWHINLAPSVAARFKRIFDGVDKSGRDVVLSDSPKNAKDLLWFRDRHPIDVEPEFRLLAQAAVEDEREQSVDRILAPNYVASDPCLALPMRDYQARSVDLAIANGGLLNGDDPGLGKTICGIGQAARRESLPVVVVTLTGLPIQWQAQFKRFAPDLRTHIVASTKPYSLTRSKNGAPLPYPDVLIMSYSKLTCRKDKSWAEWLVDHNLCRTLIFDEIQELRNADSDRYRAAKHLRQAARWCTGLSATPVMNHGGEVYNVVDIVQPGALGSEAEFLREWCSRTIREDAETSSEERKPAEMRKIRVTDPVALGAHLRQSGVYLRRTREEVKIEMPKLERIFHEVEVDEDSFSDQDAKLEELCRIVLARSGNPQTKKMAGGELNWRLRKNTGLAKAMHVAAFVRLIIEGGEKVVLFGWHHEVYDLWKQTFSDEKLGNLRPAFFTGLENPPEKNRQFRRFMDGETDLFIMSLRAGAGLDGLQHVAHMVVTGEFDWAPGIHVQNETRVFRPGQNLPVSSYFIHANYGADPVMMETLSLKTAQAEGIHNMSSDVAVLQGTDPEHIRKLASDFLRRRGKL